MSPPEQAAEAQRWLRYAGEDLRSAEVLRAASESVPRQACYLAQQAAEKAIKAALIGKGIEFQKTHNLNVLRNLLPGDHRLARDFPDLAELSAWAAEARYPGDWPEPTDQDAANALELARAIVTAAESSAAFDADDARAAGATPPIN